MILLSQQWDRSPLAQQRQETWAQGQADLAIYLHRAVEQRAMVVEIHVTEGCDTAAAETCFRGAIASAGTTPLRTSIDKATVYPSALEAVLPGTE